MTHFDGFDLSSFWDDSDYSRKEYVLPPPTTTQVAKVEAELGFKLPSSYVELMRWQNGGVLQRNAFPTTEPTSWAEDHVAITGIFGIGDSKTYSLCGELGSAFMLKEWGYPNIGIYFGNCPSAGHDMICLDYRDCGRSGDPRVVHVDQELEYRVTHLADSFEDFVVGLVPEEDFDDPDDVGPPGVLWCPELMSASVLRDDEYLKIGQYLNVTQDLPEGIYGWLNMKINIPEHWQIEAVSIVDGVVRICTARSGTFCVTRDVASALSFAILELGDDASDTQLEGIWRQEAASE